jgi:predicted PurR-regulated permease PerM
MRVHDKGTIYFSDMTSFRKKTFDVQGIRPFEHIRPRTFSPFIIRVEAKSIDQTPKLIDQTPKLIDQILKLIDQIPKLIDQIPKLIDQTPKLIDQISKLIDQIPKLIDQKLHDFIAEWKGMDGIYSRQVAEVQTISINL